MIYTIGHNELISSNLITPSTVEHCLNHFKKHKEISVDTETTDYNPREGKIVMLQIGDPYDQFVIDVRKVPLLLFKELIESKTIVGQNLGYDFKWLFHNGIRINKLYDIMIAEAVLYCGYEDWGYGLDSLAQRYCNAYLDKSTRNEFQYIGDSPFTLKHILYGADDVKYPMLIKDAQGYRTEKYELKYTIALENKAVVPLSFIEYYGMYLNKEEWLAYEVVAKTRLREIELELDDLLIEKNKSYYQLGTYMKPKKKKKEELVPYIGAGLWGDVSADRRTLVNWNSDIQVKSILKDEFNFEALNKEGKPTINSVILGKIKEKPSIVDKLIEFAEKAKEISTYGKSFIDQYVQKDGRIRTSFWQVKNTGRVSSGNKKQGAANTQNIPEVHRAFIEAPAGRTLVVCDYSQQEPRVTADYCQDPKLLDFVLNGDGDSHSLVASAVFSKIEGREVKVTKYDNPYSDRFKMTYRQVGKQINLGLDYGKTAFSIKDDLGVTQEEAQEFIDALKEAFPKKEEFFDAKKKEFWELGYILHDYVVKRKTFKPEFSELVNFNYDAASKEERSRYFKMKGGVERDVQNYPIQGTSASMTKLAMVYIQEEFDKTGIDAFLINSVHDEIVSESAEECAEQCAKIMEECMVRAGKVFCKTVPMKVDPVITKKWNK